MGHGQHRDTAFSQLVIASTEVNQNQRERSIDSSGPVKMTQRLHVRKPVELITQTGIT